MPVTIVDVENSDELKKIAEKYGDHIAGIINKHRAALRDLVAAAETVAEEIRKAPTDTRNAGVHYELPRIRHDDYQRFATAVAAAQKALGEE